MYVQKIVRDLKGEAEGATEAVDLAWNSTLDAGLEFERKAFYLLFATEDKKEGVDAFVNKRKATFKGR